MDGACKCHVIALLWSSKLLDIVLFLKLLMFLFLVFVDVATGHSCWGILNAPGTGMFARACLLTPDEMSLSFL